MVNGKDSNAAKTGDKGVASTAVCSPEQPPPTIPQALRRQRGEKIQQHLEIILESKDTLQACMGAVLCDILDTCQTLKIALAEKIGGPSSPMTGVEKSMPLLQLYLQTIRQAERLANLDCRIRESRSPRSVNETE